MTYRRVAIAGAGAAGAALAEACARGGVHVVFYDADGARLRAALDAIQARLFADGEQTALTRIEPVDSVEQLGSAAEVVDLREDKAGALPGTPVAADAVRASLER